MAGARYYQGNKSPNEEERRLFGYSKAWMHHKGRNRHHFEYWTDYSPKTRMVEPVEMPINYVSEMFCDRVAASKIYSGKNYKDTDPLNYFLKSKATRFIHPKTSDELENMLTILSEKGEDEAFSYIRKRVKAFRKDKK